MVNTEKVKLLVKHITLANEIEIPENLVNVNWDSEIKGDPENQVLLLTWEDEIGQEFSIILTEQGLSDAKVSGNVIVCYDHEGNEIMILLWDRAPHNIIL